ncbi:hypothetical protein JXL21_10415 [Candidatus Bathyarchaeota archaeon]|nr:hypothetical protein [Candidatus Bathyarchaeota archaeon]
MKNFEIIDKIIFSFVDKYKIFILFAVLDGEGVDVFIEIVSGKITERKSGRILNYYSILANLDPPLKEFRFIVLGEDITVLQRLGLLQPPSEGRSTSEGWADSRRILTSR